MSKVKAKQRANGESDAYRRHREKAGKRQRQEASSGQNIGPPPDVVNPQRREEGGESLRAFCLYFPERFKLPFCADHYKIMDRLEAAVRTGGRFVLATPRGTGKSSLCEVAAIWAVLYGYSDFVALIGQELSQADEMMKSIKSELEDNDLLFEDFPEVCHPIRALENQPNRCNRQHIDGVRTRISWSQLRIVLPTTEGSVASGAIIKVAGITAGLRGFKFRRPDGRISRPDLALIDDPQTDEVAGSPYQCAVRERIIKRTILGLAGPGKRISVAMPCTVIRRGDLADTFLDKQKNPEWQSERMKMLYRFPSAMKLWEQYADMRADEMRNDGDGHLATEFYSAHREEMDAGAVVAWPERMEPGDLSGIQHAMNLYYRDADHSYFFAECQNEPLREEMTGEQLQPEDLSVRVNGLEPGTIPVAATKVTAFVDVQKKLLYWMVAAWSEDFTGGVIDYGSFPSQSQRYFTLVSAKKTLAKQFPGHGLEGSVTAGLSALTDDLLGREWKGANGAAFKIGRLLVDSQWGDTKDAVHAWCRSTPHAALVMPSRGVGIGAAGKPMSEYIKKPGEQLGFHWFIGIGGGKRVTREVAMDVNFWKSFLASRLSVPIGDKGAVTFYGTGKTDHRMLIEHLCSEYKIRTEGRGRTVDEWRQRPDRPDNHYLDCLVGSAAAASMLGCTLAFHRADAAPTKAATRSDYERKRKAFEARRGYA